MLPSSAEEPMQEFLDSPAAPLQQRFIQLHDSVLNRLLAQMDTRTKCALMCTCTQAHKLVARQEHWRELAFDTANEQHGLEPSVLFSLLKRSQGACEVIQLARYVWGLQSYCCVGRQVGWPPTEAVAATCDKMVFEHVLPHRQVINMIVLN